MLNLAARYRFFSLYYENPQLSYFAEVKWKIKFILDLRSFSVIPFKDCSSQGVFPVCCAELSSQSCPSTNFAASFLFLPLLFPVSWYTPGRQPVLWVQSWVPFGLAVLRSMPDHRPFLKSQTIFWNFRGSDPHLGGEVRSELSEGLLASPSSPSILSGSDSHSDSLFFFWVSSFSPLGLWLSFWTVGKIIFKTGLCSVPSCLIFFF